MSSPARATARSSITASISACLARPLWWPWSILPPAQGMWLSPSPWSPSMATYSQDLHPTSAPATLPAWSYSSSTKRKKPLGFLRRMRMAFSVISTMEGSVDVLRFSSYFMSLGSKRPGEEGEGVHARAALCLC